MVDDRQRRAARLHPRRERRLRTAHLHRRVHRRARSRARRSRSRARRRPGSAARRCSRASGAAARDRAGAGRRRLLPRAPARCRTSSASAPPSGRGGRAAATRTRRPTSSRARFPRCGASSRSTAATTRSAACASDLVDELTRGYVRAAPGRLTATSYDPATRRADGDRRGDGTTAPLLAFHPGPTAEDVEVTVRGLGEPEVEELEGGGLLIQRAGRGWRAWVARESFSRRAAL